MELTKYEIVKGLVVSSKSHVAGKKLNQVVIRVHEKAHKPQIKQAVESLFGVKIDTVRIHIKKLKRSSGVRRNRAKIAPRMYKEKIAYITLSKGYTVDLLAQQGDV